MARCRIVTTRFAAVASLAVAAPLVVTLLPNVASAAPSTTAPNVSVTWADVHRIAAYVEDHPTRYSGIYFDKTSNGYTITLPNGADLSAGLRDATAPFSAEHSTGKQITVSAQHRQRSIAQLRAIEDQIAAGTGQFGALAGKSVVQWGLNEKDNVVVVGVTQAVTPALLSAAQATYGDSVQLRETTQHYAASRTITADQVKVVHAPAAARTAVDSTITPMASSGPDRLQDAQPYWAGDRLVYWWTSGNTTYITQCTSGWNAGVVNGVRTNNTYMFTAGHCFPAGAAIYQGYYDESSGTLYATGEVGPVNARKWGDNQPDWESINPANYSGIFQAYYIGALDAPSGLAEYDLRAAIYGEPVCADGSFTGESCNGTVFSTDGCESIAYDDAGHSYNVCHLDYAASLGSRLVQHGDSGGPVMAFDGGNDQSGINVGVISAGNVGTDADPGPGTEMEFTDGGAICAFSGEC